MGSLRIYAVQNCLAAMVFALLLAAQGSAYLLYHYPASELCWALSINLNRLASPLLGVFDFGFGFGFAASAAVLAGSIAISLLAWRHRHWLMTAIAGHIALAICVILTVGAIRRIGPIERTASLGPFGGATLVDYNSICLGAVTLAMVGLCLLDHALFFRHLRRV